MKKYVESMLEQGQQDSKIRTDLAAAGWNKADVDHVVNYSLLKKFVKNKINAGFPKEKIKQSLILKGWKQQTVEGVFNELKI